MSSEPTPEERRALFRVIRGEPDDEELAALTAVLAAASANAAARADEDEGGQSFWVDRQAAFRRPLYPGPGAWRASMLPR